MFYILLLEFSKNIHHCSLGALHRSNGLIGFRARAAEGAGLV